MRTLTDFVAGQRGIRWTQQRADAALGLVAMAWGSSYLLMKMGLEGIPPLSMIALRFGIAFLTVAPIFARQLRRTTPRTLRHGAILGLFLFGLFAFLMYGLRTTSASAAGFLTSATVVFVPLLQAIFRRKAPDAATVVGTAAVMAGIGLLTLRDAMTLQWGELLCLGGALLYACQILLTDVFTHQEDGLLLGVWQLAFAALLGFVASLLLEAPAWPANAVQWAAVFGLALLCSAFGFVLQPVAQRYTTPEHAGLLFAMEPVFSALLAFLFLRETLDARGYAGAALILISVLFAARGKPAPQGATAIQSEDVRYA